jgi:predicted nucleic acid-binding protein
MTAPFACVVDASVAVKLSLAEPLAAEAAALFGQLADPSTRFHVPDLFYAECANIFWKYTQRGLSTAAKLAADLAALQSLPLLRTPTFDVVADALAFAVAHGITAYDACYVVLAQRLSVPLITADQRLQQKLAGVVPGVVWLGNWAPPAGLTP